MRAGVLGKWDLFERELEVVGMKAECKIRNLRGLASAVGMGLLCAAVVQEMRKPRKERAWHGRLWGRVPYEFRPPTMERLRQAYWAPQDSHVFTDTAFGVGWSLNLGRLVHAWFGGCMQARGGKGHGPLPTAA